MPGLRIRHSLITMSLHTLTSALAYLKMLEAPSLSGALHYLGFQVERREFLKLFQEIFPQSAKIAFARAAKQMPEARFFQLIEQRLFPLDADLCIEALNSGDLPGGMPLQTVNNYVDDWMLEDCTDNWGLAERVARFLASGFNEAAEVLVEIGWDGAITPIGWNEWVFDARIFEGLCAAIDPELSQVIQMVNLVSGATDNFWLDTTSEGMNYYLWEFSKESIQQLAQEYTAAAKIQQAAMRVIDYLNQRPQLLKRVIHCWQLSLRPAPARQQEKQNVS